MTTQRGPTDKYWWDDIREPVRIDIKPTEEQQAELSKTTKVRQGCGLVFFGIIIRVYCFVMGVLTMGYGAWILYQIKANLQPLPILGNVAGGGFLVLAGLLTILAETRTRRTFQSCLNTLIFLSNPLARGIFYIVIGGITFAFEYPVPYIGTWGNPKILAGFIVAGGLMNLLYAPFRFRYLRQKELSQQSRGIAYAEEVAYEMNITHISQIKVPISDPQPIVVDALEVMPGKQMCDDTVNGAGFVDVDLSASKGKAKEHEQVFGQTPSGVAAM